MALSDWARYFQEQDRACALDLTETTIDSDIRKAIKSDKDASSALRKLLAAKLTEANRNDAFVYMLVRSAYQLHIDILSSTDQRIQVAGIIDRYKRARLQLRQNSECLLNQLWGGWNILELEQLCSRNLEEKLAQLCRHNEPKSSAIERLRAQIAKRRDGSARGVSKTANLLPSDVAAVIKEVQNEALKPKVSDSMAPPHKVGNSRKKGTVTKSNKIPASSPASSAMPFTADSVHDKGEDPSNEDGPTVEKARAGGDTEDPAYETSLLDDISSWAAGSPNPVLSKSNPRECHHDEDKSVSCLTEGRMLCTTAIDSVLSARIRKPRVMVVSPSEAAKFDPRSEWNRISRQPSSPAEPPSRRRLRSLKDAEQIIIPYHDVARVHWSLFVVQRADATSSWSTITHYDSARSDDCQASEIILRYIRWLLQDSEAVGLSGVVSQMECPQQLDGVNCGVHVITNALRVAGIPESSDPLDYSLLRKKYATMAADADGGNIPSFEPSVSPTMHTPSDILGEDQLDDLERFIHTTTLEHATLGRIAAEEQDQSDHLLKQYRAMSRFRRGQRSYVDRLELALQQLNGNIALLASMTFEGTQRTFIASELVGRHRVTQLNEDFQRDKERLETARKHHNLIHDRLVRLSSVFLKRVGVMKAKAYSSSSKLKRSRKARNKSVLECQKRYEAEASMRAQRLRSLVSIAFDEEKDD
ncbi:MAG: hypothetical protein Q9170_007913 [Blastenia crenularia]